MSSGMNQHERIEELLAADALGGLGPSDEAELAAAWEDHGQHCESCQRARAEFGEIAGRLAFVLPPAPVSQDMADRILRMADERGSEGAGAAPSIDRGGVVRHEERGAQPGLPNGRIGTGAQPPWWARRVVAVAAAVALLVTGGVGGFLAANRSDDRAALATFLAEPGTRVASFEGSAAGSLKVAYRPGEDRAYVFGSDLDPAPEGTVYKLWMIPGAGAPTPGPSFSPGDGVVIVEVPGDPSEAGAMAMTFEENPDTPAPTVTPSATAATPA